MDSKASDKDWIAEHTLTEQDLRKLILEKMERARLLQSVKENRNRTDREFA
jgi:hypothetical protein